MAMTYRSLEFLLFSFKKDKRGSDDQHSPNKKHDDNHDASLTLLLKAEGTLLLTSSINMILCLIGPKITRSVHQ
jgi:hypothetical protein